MYYIYFRNTKGRLCSTIHNLPLTSICIPTDRFEEDGKTRCYIFVPCKFIDLSKYNK